MAEAMADVDVFALPPGITRFATWHLDNDGWRNNGGFTKEIGSGRFPNQPHGLNAPWDWRLSVATISQDGPFSSFFQIDRTAVLIEGAVTLKAQACQLDFCEVGDCEDFPGESVIEATVARGTPRLLNVMVQRQRGAARVMVHRGSASIAPPLGSMTCLFVASGLFRLTLAPKASTRAGRCDLIADEGILWSGVGMRGDVERVSDDGSLIEVQICPVPRSH